MIKKVVLIGVGLVAILSLSISQSTYAHFFVSDQDSRVKAIFHVTPDHDPIAGEESVISYDFAKTDVSADEFTFTLAVKSTKAEAVDVPLEVSGNVVLASYTFPVQGFYAITLKATNTQSGLVSKLQYNQRVSRGEKTEEKNEFGMVEIGIIAAVSLVGAGAIIFSFRNDSKNRRNK